MELEVSLPKDNYLGEPELREGRIYLAKYNSNRDGWVVDIEHSRYDNIRSLTTLSSLKTPEGEYRLIAYNPSGFRSLFLDFFEGVVGEEDHTFKVIGSVKEKSSDQALMPLQIAAWQDGTRVLIRSPNPINISLGLTNPTLESVPAGYTLATTRGYILRSTGSSTGAQLSLLLPYISRQLNSKNITINDLYGARREENSTSQFSVITRTVPVGSSSVLTKGPIINLPGEYTLLAKLPESKGKEIPKTEVLPTIISSSTNRLDFNYHNDFFLKTINLIIIIFWRMSFAGL
ncbi:hypothetical protein BY996DRAFT_6692845 [Phakopsora pachyrhizi]|nr:hypothetical protein BY996DRAFT_6778433 [Phakopsora pachyrhizi]KAI8460972.1 hypothetical protein BY996DRAFT_6692845 [Phakopsora pachyrhizi]